MKKVREKRENEEKKYTLIVYIFLKKGTVIDK